MPRPKKIAAAPATTPTPPDPVGIVAGALYGFAPDATPDLLDHARHETLHFIEDHAAGKPADALSKIYGVSPEAVTRGITAIRQVMRDNLVAATMFNGILQRVDRHEAIIARTVAVVQAQQPPLKLATAIIDAWTAEAPGFVRVALSAFNTLRDRIAGTMMKERQDLQSALNASNPPRSRMGMPAPMTIPGPDGQPVLAFVLDIGNPFGPPPSPPSTGGLA